MKKIDIFLAIISLLCILDTIAVLMLRGGTNTGNMLPAYTGILLLIYIMFRRTKYYSIAKPTIKRIEKSIIILFSIWFLSFAIVVTISIASSISNKTGSSDCVLILGAGLHGDSPSLVLIERMDLALDYIKNNPGVKVVVSGGQGPGESITEAEAMERYLVSHGVSDSNIVKEEKSTSTMENLIYSKNEFEKHFGYKLKRITIFTSDFHMFRTKMLARRAGLEAYGISARTPEYLYPNVFLREYLALIKSLLVDRAIPN